MKPRTPGLWLIPAIIGLLMPSLAIAGMTPAEVKSFEFFKAKAQKGDPEAQFFLGGCYVDGTGVAKDKVAGVEWYRKAADQGYVVAQHELGYVYRVGDVVLRDDVEATKWYRKAADQGESFSQYELGNCYYNGIFGVAKDEVEAYAYFNLARKNCPMALREFNYMERHLSPEDRLRGQQRSRELQKEIEAKMKIAAKKVEDDKKSGK